MKKLCALAHIDLAPEGDPHGGLDVVAVQKDVGAMLRCMQTMRKANDDRISAAGEVEELDQGGGPWGDAAEWAAPLQAVSTDGLELFLKECEQMRSCSRLHQKCTTRNFVFSVRGVVLLEIPHGTFIATAGGAFLESISKRFARGVDDDELQIQPSNS